MSYFQVNDRCNGCLACVQNCPGRALDSREEGARLTLLHNMSRCARCATCWRVCPQKAVEFASLLTGPWDEVVSLELLRCGVCGEPVHTGRLPPGLPEKVRELAEPLCARHRAQRVAGVVAGRRRPRGGQAT